MAEFAKYGLSDDDVKFLAEHMHHLRNLVVNRSRPPQEHAFSEGEDHQAPETYVAKPWRAYNETGTGDDAEIPAMTNVDETGTGTLDYPIPGLAKCAIYKLDTDPFGSPLLKPLGGRSSPEDHVRWVYNVYRTSSSDYFPVTRDKFGNWLALIGGGGNGGTIRFQILSAGAFYGTGDVGGSSTECTSVQALVLDESCGGVPDVAVGDEVTIWDPSGCWFNIPIDNLEFAYGTAVFMQSGGTWDAVGCYDYPESFDDNCWWMVTQLCCLEEVGT